MGDAGQKKWQAFLQATGRIATVSGLTESIAVLDAGGYSESQLDVWHAAWQKFGAEHEELSIPLAALDNSIQVIKTGDDRPLFNLPLEIRKIVKPLLKNTLSNH